MFDTPILLIIFNRPQTTQRIFDVLKGIRPKYLYIAADGPRNNRPEEIDKCLAVREIIKQIDWECQLRTDFREKNLGCGVGPSTSISWFLEFEEEGIILEDDCLPHYEFFHFCAELLSKYRDNPKVLSITGSNFQDGKNRGNGSYYFSIHNRIWGWATWKRTWEKYDYFLQNISENEFKQIIRSLFRLKCERSYWLDVFKYSKATQTDNSAWDYQFMFLQWKLGGLTVTPNSNLISNIGYGEDATHTAWGKDNPSLNRPIEEIYPLVHPAKIEHNRKADEYYFLKYIKPKSNLLNRLSRKIKKLLFSSRV
jgi:hypothetical protein